MYLAKKWQNGTGGEIEFAPICHLDAFRALAAYPVSLEPQQLLP
jgi:hypothetical protein